VKKSRFCLFLAVGVAEVLLNPAFRRYETDAAQIAPLQSMVWFLRYICDACSPPGQESIVHLVEEMLRRELLNGQQGSLETEPSTWQHQQR
jgi:hypothetical protein